jgi:hypothetical protein
MTPSITPTRTPQPGTLTFVSLGAQDGWVLETSEQSNTGGLTNANTFLYLGDDQNRKQYRAILSFNTSSLPDNATITSITLKLKKKLVAGGGNPVSMFQGFFADVKNGPFGTSALQASDFQALGKSTYGPLSFRFVNNVYSLRLTIARNSINKLTTNGGLTQIRLRFNLDDNNNTIANYLSLYGAEASIASERPQLVIEYTVP